MQAQFVGVVAAFVGQFVEERFVEEVVERVAHRTPVAEHGRALDVDLRDALVGDGVGLARQPFERRGVEFFALFAGDGFGGAFGSAHRLNGHRQALVVQRSAELDHRDRAQHIAQELFFAAPDQFDRAAYRLGQGDGLRVGVGRVVQEMPAKKAAQQRRVQGDLFDGEPGALGHVGAEHIRRLVGQPHFQRAIGVEAGQGRRRLQLGVVEVLVVVGRFNFGLGVGQRAGHVALVFVVTGRALLGGKEVAVLVAGEVRRHRAHARTGGRFQPFHLDRLHRPLGMPPAFGNDRHGARQLVNRVHAFHGLDLCLVAQAADGHAQAWRMLDGGVEHAVDLEVDAVLGLAGGFVVGIQAFDRLADPAKLARVAQRNRGRVGHRHVQGPTGQLTVTQRAAGSGVYDAAGLRGQLRYGHPQLLGAGLQQHGAGQGAEAAHGWVAHADGHAATGDAHAVFHHHIGFPGRCGLNHEGGRVGIQFFADNLRHRGVGALPAFHEGAEQAHAAVRANLEKCRHLGPAFCGAARCGISPGRTQRQAEADDQRTDGGAGQKAPTGQIDRFAQWRVEWWVARSHQALSVPAGWAASSCTAVRMAL